MDLLFPQQAEAVLAAAARAWLRSTSVLGAGESTFLVMGKPPPQTQRAFIRGGGGGRTRMASAGTQELHPVSLPQGCLQTHQVPPAVRVQPVFHLRAWKEK